MDSSSAAISAASLVFYPEPHEYWTPPGREGGRLVPNVTSILKAVRVSEDFDAIERRQPGRVEHRRQLGSVVHTDAHAYDDDDLDLATVDPVVRPFIDAWIAWRENHQAEPLQRERRVFHPGLHYCGTLDGIFLIGSRRVLVDIKIGDPAAAAARFQTAAYEAAYLAEHPTERIDERWSVQLTPDLDVPYRICPYTDWTDFRTFQAFLTTYHHQYRRTRDARHGC